MREFPIEEGVENHFLDFPLGVTGFEGVTDNKCLALDAKNYQGKKWNCLD